MAAVRAIYIAYHWSSSHFKHKQLPFYPKFLKVIAPLIPNIPLLISEETCIAISGLSIFSHSFSILRLCNIFAHTI